MRNLIPFAMLLFCLAASTAPALAEIYIKKDTGKVEIKPDDTPEEPVSRDITDYANGYYKNCMKKDHPVIRGEHLEMLCACTASKIPGTMTPEQMSLLQDDTEEGLTQRNRMLMFVYTPCIAYPVRALVEDNCMNNAKIKTDIKSYRKVCSCLGEKMGETTSQQAPKIIETALRRDPRDLDPLALLVNSKGFELQSRAHTRECLLRHQFGMLK